MGAAGYITIYDRKKFEEQYRAQNPGRDPSKDWWYLDTITAEIEGKKYIFDYADDQGIHEGSGNDFWFSPRDEEAKGSSYGDSCQKNQLAAREALKGCRVTHVEVWT